MPTKRYKSKQKKKTKQIYSKKKKKKSKHNKNNKNNKKTGGGSTQNTVSLRSAVKIMRAYYEHKY